MGGFLSAKVKPFRCRGKEVANRPEIDWKKLHSSLKSIPKLCANAYANLFAEAANRLSWDVEVLSRSKSVILCHPGKDRNSFLIRRHKVEIMCDPAIAKLFRNKFTTHRRLTKMGVPCPQTLFAHFTEAKKSGRLIPILHMQANRCPYVVKPVEGSQGKGVHMNLNSKQAMIDALTKIWSKDQVPCLVQEQVEGFDYRILTLKGKILDIVQRIPASVVGDGKQTTNELIKAENRKRKACSLPQLVKSSALGPFTDVPNSGERRTIQDKANVSLGGEPVQVPFDQVHRQNIQLFNQIIAEFPSQLLMGIDFLGDLRRSWRKPCARPPLARRPFSGVVLELNSSPQMFCHSIRGNNCSLDIIQKILLGAAATAQTRKPFKRRNSKHHSSRDHSSRDHSRDHSRRRSGEKKES